MTGTLVAGGAYVATGSDERAATSEVELRGQFEEKDCI